MPNVFNYSQQRELELQEVAIRAEEQIRWNKIWIEQGINLMYNSEGKLVETRAIPFTFDDSQDLYNAIRSEMERNRNREIYAAFSGG